MLFQSIKLFWVLQNAPLFQACFLLHLRNLPNHQNFPQQVPASRSVSAPVCMSKADYMLHLFSFIFSHTICFIQQQLQALLETLSATEPHYIRCVKPNNALKPAIFENNNVLQQLRCGVSFHMLVNPFFWLISSLSVCPCMMVLVCF